MIKNRLIAFLEYLDIGQNKFAQNVGLSAGFVNNLGENISSKSLNKIISAYPQLNKNWLLTGKGEMLKPLSINQTSKGDGSFNNINGNIEGNITISHNDFLRIIEIQKELNERLKTSQKQIDTLLEILKNK